MVHVALHLLEAHPRLGRQARGLEACTCQRGADRHRKAAGVRGGEQFFRIGSGRVPEAGRERVGRLLQRTTVRSQ